MDTASSFASLRKMLKLINAEVNTVEPDDFAYVSSGYAPISIRLVQAATQGWLGKDELLRELPGRLVDVNQRDPPEDLSSALKRKPTINLGTLAKSLVVNSEQKPVLLVFFIGGVTFMEIAALRFLSKRTIFPYQIICCTTKIINGSSFLQSLS
uniref:Vacuolar protein sorting-associated protein 33A n=2 Tax=Eucampia antarctica TaxID=49252 RepID=A0A7S2WG57_9STRA|mmetsp:Transcript_29368/g.28240  ORF Transcript_29368/g.28240 Transcript_29368/m.28240 type:complete len:154 (+) Transcript_29368:93-554(+)